MWVCKQTSHCILSENLFNAQLTTHTFKLYTQSVYVQHCDELEVFIFGVLSAAQVLRAYFDL